MRPLLTELQRRKYPDHGLVFPIRVLELSEATLYRDHCDELERQLGGRPRTIDVRQMHLHFPWAWELATHPRVLDAAEAVLGRDLLVWATELFAKHPHDSAIAISWHRDRPYMGFEGPVTTAWIALSNCTPSNGCMQARLRDPSKLQASDSESIVDVELRPGDMSLHDPDVLHGSQANTGDEKRVGFAIRFVTPEARPLRGRPPVAVARGRIPHDRFTIVESPNESRSAEALAAMRSSAAAHLDSVLENLQLAKS
jgi:hypothetical protein